MRITRYAPTLVLASLWLGSCADFDPTEPPGANLDPREDLQPETGMVIVEPETRNRFDVTLEAQGSFTPGNSIHVRVTLRALVPTTGVRLELTAPEVVAAEMTSWGTGFHLPLLTRMPPFAGWMFDAKPGVDYVFTATLQVPVEGTYRIVGTARTATADRALSPEGLELNDMTSELIWVWIEEGAGRTGPSKEGDPRLGPRVRPDSPSTTGPQPQPELKLQGIGSPTGSPPSCSSSREVCGWAGFYDSEYSQYVPFSGVRVHGIMYEGQFGQPFNEFEYHTDNNGYALMECTDMNDYVEGAAKLIDADLTFTRIETPFYYDYTDCGSLIELGPLNLYESKIYRNMRTAVDNSRAFFGASRAKLLYKVRTDSPNIARYWRNDDFVEIGSNRIWGQDHRKTHVHEYGHGLHWKALGGYPTSPSCVSGLGYASEHNLACAVREGFADYHAFVATTDIPGWISDAEDNVWLDQGEDGSIVPRAVAAKLYDLTDPANETWDAADSWSGTYIAQIIQTCEASNNGSTFFRADGVDHWIYCLERQVDPAVTGDPEYFATRTTDPVAQREGATEPSGWAAATVRSIWRKNLYLEQ